MKQNTIKFTIRQDGTVTEEVIGANGQECEHLTRSIDDKLGKVTQKLFKPQYYNPNTSKNEENVPLHNDQN
jgi:hypothetical protein|tara:strand:- start:52 stop:264 length:213 start_codon:yes stop_codon:yes gene_type:complete